MTRWLGELSRYARHIAALFVPNTAAPAQAADCNDPGDLTPWKEDDLHLLIEEGRRQIDRQHDDLERIRTRAQIVLALGLALVGTIAALDNRITTSGSDLARVLWVAGLVSGAWSILGAAATSVVKADVEMIDATTLSTYETPIQSRLAADYAGIVVAGENQLATRLTNLRHAVMWLLIAAVFALLTWVESPKTSEPSPAKPVAARGKTQTSQRVDPMSGARNAAGAGQARTAANSAKLT